VAECRARLLDRRHSEEEVDRAIAHLLETSGLDDGRVARAFARTAAEVKGRGRLRVQRELLARGVDRDTAAEAVGEIFGDKDEQALLARALQKKLRGRPRPSDPAAYARLYQHLMRQGFSPTAVSAELGKLRRQKDDELE